MAEIHQIFALFFFGKFKTSKSHSEINWPLESKIIKFYFRRGKQTQWWIPSGKIWGKTFWRSSWEAGRKTGSGSSWSKEPLSDHISGKDKKRTSLEMDRTLSIALSLGRREREGLKPNNFWQIFTVICTFLRMSKLIAWILTWSFFKIQSYIPPPGWT